LTDDKDILIELKANESFKDIRNDIFFLYPTEIHIRKFCEQSRTLNTDTIIMCPGKLQQTI
jgi:hypothetical protein